MGAETTESLKTGLKVASNVEPKTKKNCRYNPYFELTPDKEKIRGTIKDSGQSNKEIHEIILPMTKKEVLEVADSKNFLETSTGKQASFLLSAWLDHNYPNHGHSNAYWSV